MESCAFKRVNLHIANFWDIQLIQAYPAFIYWQRYKQKGVTFPVPQRGGEPFAASNATERCINSPAVRRLGEQA